jgi:hypothetical protein
MTRQEMGKPPIDVQRFTPCSEIRGEDPEETASLLGMLEDAKAYLKSFRWSEPVAKCYLGFGIGEVLALFLFRFKTPIHGTDEWLWVVIGDAPSAYFVIDQAGDAASALETYCGLMDAWAKAVLRRLPLEDVFPVNAVATAKNAKMLLSRIKFIREKIIPEVRRRAPRE